MKFKKLMPVSVLVLICLCTVLQASDSYLTPLPGNPLRKQVLDALRNEVKRIHGLDVVFVVKHLRVKDGWAWIHSLPQSPDGSNRYEDISALLRFGKDGWKVAEIPCGEVENPDCLNGPEYFKRLNARYPTVANEIFPDWVRDAMK